MNLSTLLMQGIGVSGASSNQSLPQLLSAIRQHLKMDVAFISEFVKDRRIFRQADPAGASNPVQPGASDPLEESYCMRVVDGRLPELIQDAKQYPAAAELPVTYALPVGAHLSVPIRLGSGSIYGTFCCFSYLPDQTLDERDLSMMRVFAELAARLIDSERTASQRQEEMEDRVRAAFANDSLSIVYQPIYDLHHSRVAGFEALSRFVGRPTRSPDIWFSEANEIGLGAELEARAIQLGLQGLSDLPDDVYVSVNISPKHILEGALDRIFEHAALDRVMLEITEHAVVDHYDDLATLIKPFRERGMKIAIDDAGAGYASFRHILNLAPDRIKLDMSLTCNIDTDYSRRALAAAFVRFCDETACDMVAEGVETASQMHTLQELGISKMQGFYVGRPMHLQQAARLCYRN